LPLLRLTSEEHDREDFTPDERFPSNTLLKSLREK
jgi:hypothetical protein